MVEETSSPSISDLFMAWMDACSQHGSKSYAAKDAHAKLMRAQGEEPPADDEE